MKKSIVALWLMGSQSLCWGVIPSSPDNKLVKRRSVSSSELCVLAQRWVEERSQSLARSHRPDTSKGQSLKLDNIIPLQCAFPPPSIWTESNSPCHLIAKLITEMEPFTPSSTCTRPPHPLKGLGRLIETTAPEAAHNILMALDHEGRLYNVRLACEIIPHDHRDRKKLARSKRFYGLSWRMRHFLETCAREPERLPFATQKLIHDANAYIQLSRIKRSYHMNKQRRHANTVQVLLKTGMCHARTNALEGVLLSSYHFDPSFRNTQDLITIITMVDDAFAMENNDSSGRTKIALSQEDLVKVLDTAFASPIILEQGLLSWPMWAKFAQSYADRGSCLTGGLFGDSFTRKMLKQYGYTK